jgi:Ser/Thr protein kinase RdoA (MazF antagonist)
VSRFSPLTAASVEPAKFRLDDHLMRVLGKSAYHCNKSLPLSQLQVMHLDLKTKNVLLTADMVGKVHIILGAC